MYWSSPGFHTTSGVSFRQRESLHGDSQTYGGDPVISENVGTLGPLKMMDTLISGPIHTNSGDLASPDTGFLQ